MPDFNKIYLSRITHIVNINHILKHGITHINSENRNTHYVSIGDNKLISKRDSFIIPNGIILGEYIPFYFWWRMPMLYVIQKGYSGVKITEAENIVYCITKVTEIIEHNLEFVFTDGHAVNKFSSFYDIEDIQEIDSILDMNAIKSKYWTDEADLDLKRRKEAEFLLAEDLPPNAIVGFVVYNEVAQAKLMELGIPELQVQIRPNFYF